MEHSDTVVRRFIEAATHELHTPLTAILGYQELLADGIYGPLEPATREAVLRIGRSAHHLMALLDGLLDAIAADAGQLDLDLDDVVVADLLREVLARAQGIASERPLQLEVDLPETLPILHTDGERLRRALDLAVIAAVRAAAADVLAIEVTTGQALTLTIRPTGITGSMLEPNLEVRASSDRLSLRLVVAQRVLRALGGDLDISGTEADGGRIRVTVPLRSATPRD